MRNLRVSEILIVGLAALAAALGQADAPPSPRRLYGEPVRTLAVSPNGRTIALGTERIIRLVAIDGKPIVQLVGHQQAVVHLCFSPDGDTLASAAEPGDPSPMQLWAMATHQPIRRWGNADRCIRGLAFTPDGQQLAVVEPDAVTLHNPRLGRFSAELPVPPRWTDLNRVAVSPDGKSLAIGCDTGRRATFDIIDRTVKYAGSAPGASLAIQYHPDNRRLIWADAYDLHLCDDDGNVVPFAAQRLLNITAIAQTSNGTRLAIARGPDLTVWDIATRTLQATLTGHRRDIRSLAFAGSQTLVSAGDDGAMIWHVP
ncbi:MAG: hypothetical protein U0746_02005 [Gemmataceae bacterium]